MQKLQRFEEYQNKNKDINNILEELENQKKEINKEMHIFKVLKVASTIQNLIDNETFKKYDVASVNIYYGYDYDYGNELLCELTDGQGSKTLKHYLPNELVELIDDNFKFLNGFTQENINDSFKHKATVTIYIVDNFKEKFIDLMLSDELKKVLTYNELQIGLSKNEVKHNKIKI